MSVKAVLAWSTFTVLGVVAGCATVPDHFSARSAASVDSPPAPSAVIARAIREEPPLPGAPSEGWVGLGGAPSTGGVAHMHHHHPGMDMSGMPGMDMSGMDMSGMDMGDAGTPPPSADAGAPSMEGMHHAH